MYLHDWVINKERIDFALRDPPLVQIGALKFFVKRLWISKLQRVQIGTDGY